MTYAPYTTSTYNSYRPPTPYNYGYGPGMRAGSPALPPGGYAPPRTNISYAGGGTVNPPARTWYGSPPANAAGGGTAPAWDPNTDPVIAQVRGQADQMTQLAQSNLLRLQKQELLGFGSQSLARSILGNDPIVNTISGNPDQSFSFLANLKRQYGMPIGSKENWTGATRMGLIPQAEEGLNQDNLWFSSTHGDTLNSLMQQKLQERDTEQRRVEGLLGGYQNDYLNAVLQAKMMIEQAILSRQNALGIV